MQLQCHYKQVFIKNIEVNLRQIMILFDCHVVVCIEYTRLSL